MAFTNRLSGLTAQAFALRTLSCSLCLNTLVVMAAWTVDIDKLVHGFGGGSIKVWIRHSEKRCLLELLKIAGMRTCECRWVWGRALELHAFGEVRLVPLGGARCDPIFAVS